MIERLKYWLFQKGKDCRRCCLRCEYYDICRWDVLNKNKIKVSIWGGGKVRGRNKALLIGIYQYVELKKKEKRKNEKF